MTVCRLAIRGDFSRLILTSRPGVLAGNTPATGCLLPWRSVRDFDAEEIPAGVEFLQIAAKEIITHETVNRGAAFFVNHQSDTASYIKSIASLRCLGGEVRIGIVPTDEDKELETECFRFKELSLEVKSDGRVTLKISGTGMNKGLIHLRHGEQTKPNKVFVTIAYDQALITPHAPGSKDAFSFENSVATKYYGNDLQKTVSQERELLPTEDSLLTLPQTTDGNYRCLLIDAGEYVVNMTKITLTPYNRSLMIDLEGVRVGSIAKTVSSTTNRPRMTYAFWGLGKYPELERNQKTTSKRFRLEEALGYGPNNTSNREVAKKFHNESFVLEYLARASERCCADEAVLMFNDLGFEEGYCSQSEFWAGDLCKLSKTFGFHDAKEDQDGVRLVMGIIGRTLPVFLSVSQQRDLFVKAIKFWIRQTPRIGESLSAHPPESKSFTEIDSDNWKVVWEGDSLTMTHVLDETKRLELTVLLGTRDVEVKIVCSKQPNGLVPEKLRFELYKEIFLAPLAPKDLTLWDALYCFFPPRNCSRFISPYHTSTWLSCQSPYILGANCSRLR